MVKSNKSGWGKAVLASFVMFALVPATSGCATFNYLVGGEESSFRTKLAEMEATYTTLVKAATVLANDGTLTLEYAEKIDIAMSLAGGALERVNEEERAGNSKEAKRYLIVAQSFLLEFNELLSRKIDVSQIPTEEGV